MKVQCPCGAKYSFDVTPEQARGPVQFVCGQCGVDLSAALGQVIRQQMATEAPPPAESAAPAVSPIRVAVAKTSQPAAAPAGEAQPKPATQEDAPPTGPAPAVPCTKHFGQVATHRCLVCQKPICPKCMELFGYVCGPLCRTKAENGGIEVPAYVFEKSAVQSRYWRKVAVISSAIAAVAAVVLGVWFWYAWIGSTPRPFVTFAFAVAGHSGQCKLGPAQQLVSLHGGTLSRYDLNARRQVWSREIIDRDQISREADAANAEIKAAIQRAIEQGGTDHPIQTYTHAEMADMLERQATAGLSLHAHAENVWVRFPGRLVRFDWQSGQPGQEIPLREPYARCLPHGEDLLLVSETAGGAQAVTRINLATGQARSDEFDASSARPALAANKANPARGATNRLAAGPLAATAKASQPLDPADAAARAQNLSLAGRLALPATLSASLHNQRLDREMKDPVEPGAAALASTGQYERGTLIPTPNGLVRFSAQLIEEKSVQRQAMKAPPKKSALEGTVNAAATTAIANELLNEMQRDRGGDVVTEDLSRYRVTLRRLETGEAATWTGEVVGPPEFFPLKTVHVVAAGKKFIVLDASFKTRWEGDLSYPIGEHFNAEFAGQPGPFGDGPCVEHGNTLYIADQGVLTAFDLASGAARWRLPSVGVAGLWFDGKDMLYVNSTTASHDRLKYSRQIDISEKTRQVALKLNPKTGKILWKNEGAGMIGYVSGKFVYTAESHPGEEADDVRKSVLGTFGLIKAHVRIRRLDANRGKILWEHYQPRSPLDVQFDGNRIYLLFQKELQGLKFISL